MELNEAQQKVMDAALMKAWEDRSTSARAALWAAGTALLEYERREAIGDTDLCPFCCDGSGKPCAVCAKKALEYAASINAPAPVEGAKAEGQTQPLKVAFKRSNRVTANQQAFEDAEYAAPRAESQDTVKHTPWRTEAMTAALASANKARDEQWEQALCEELPDDSIELIERICARVTAQGKEFNAGWKSCIEDLRKSAELCRTLEAAIAQLRSQIDAAAARTLIGARAKETL